MLDFDPNDPFPLVPEERYSYAQEQMHSARVDEWLGLRTSDCEARISNAHSLAHSLAHTQTHSPLLDQNLWIGLPVQTLLTPYLEIRRVLDRLGLEPGSRVVDLGAGYGRMGFVMARHHPETEFIGYEYVSERVIEGQRAIERTRSPQGIRLLQADLKSVDFMPVEAGAYFIYDFGSRVAIEKCLQDLRRVARTRPIQVIGRGRASRDAIERKHPWLSQVISPIHGRQVSIYRSG